VQGLIIRMVPLAHLARLNLTLVMREDGRPRLGAYYLPYAQDPTVGNGLVIKTTEDPTQVAGAVRKAIAEIDPELLFSDVKPLPARVDPVVTLAQR